MSGEGSNGSSNQKVALITGITGQDGSYLAEFLIEKGYEVHGVLRRSSSFNTGRIQHLYGRPACHTGGQMHLHYGDLTDTTCLINIITKTRPKEIYNLGAQSHVKVSFELSEYTAQVDAIGTLRLLEAVKAAGLERETKIYQASTSELYGKVVEVPQNEKTPFYPRSPYEAVKAAGLERETKIYQASTSELYGKVVEVPQNEKTPFYPRSPCACAKLYGYWIVVNYREAYNMFACNGLLFNHESPRRGESFVTRKITRGVAKIELGLLDCLQLGNLDSKRDWGHAKDYVEAMWLMLQREVPEDFVVATGEAHSVREFVEKAFACVGRGVQWRGSGVEETGLDRNTGQVLVKVNPKYFRPTEVDLLLGDATKARELLGWTPKVTFEQLVKDMVEADLELMRRNPEA